MNEEINCVTNKAKRFRINGKMVNLTFFVLYTMYIYKEIRTILFPYLLINLFEQRHSSSVKSYKYLNKLAS